MSQGLIGYEYAKLKIRIASQSYQTAHFVRRTNLSRQQHPSLLNPQPLDPKELNRVAINIYYQDARSSYRELPHENTALSELIMSSKTTMRGIAPPRLFTHLQKFPHLESRETELECHDWNPMPQWQDDHNTRPDLGSWAFKHS